MNNRICEFHLKELARHTLDRLRGRVVSFEEEVGMLQEIAGLQSVKGKHVQHDRYIIIIIIVIIIIIIISLLIILMVVRVIIANCIVSPRVYLVRGGVSYVFLPYFPSQMCFRTL